MPSSAISKNSFKRSREKLTLLAGALNLDNLAFRVHHDVHVDFGVRIFLVIEVEHKAAFNQTNADGGNHTARGSF